MSADLNPASIKYIACIENELVGFIALLPLPSGVIKNGWRIHRLVVLPEYQGLSVGTKLLNFMCDYYLQQGKKCYIKTSHYKLRQYMKFSKLWKATSSNEVLLKPHDVHEYNVLTKINMKHDYKRLCGSFEYMGKQYANCNHLTLKISDDTIKTIENNSTLKSNFLNQLINLKNEYYLSVVLGNAYSTTTLEYDIFKLGIRTELLHLRSTQSGQIVTSINSKFDDLPYFDCNKSILSQYQLYMNYQSNDDDIDIDELEITKMFDNGNNASATFEICNLLD